jgi:uncharacterized protein with HEPN domain
MPKFNIKREDEVRLRHKDNVPTIPWNVIVGMRNRLIHAYFSINLNVVWSTSTEDIPPLVNELERLLGEV